MTFSKKIIYEKYFLTFLILTFPSMHRFCISFPRKWLVELNVLYIYLYSNHFPC